MGLEEERQSYCGQGLEDFHTSYHKFHFSILLTACVVGAVGNLLNVVVLARPRLRSPVNVVLAALAVAHLALLVETLAITVGDVPRLQNSSYLRSILHLAHINCGAVLFFLTRTLVVFALVWSMYDPNKTRNSKHAAFASVIAFIASIVLHIPLFISFKITPEYQQINEEDNLVFHYHNDTNLNKTFVIFYHWSFSKIATNNEYLLVQVNEWVYGFVFVVVPCLISLILIVFKLASNQCHHQCLKLNHVGPIETRTLLLISMLSVITDLLLSILYLLKVLLGQEFVLSCILALNEVIELMTFIFPITTVFVYCKTSKPYWSTLVATFKPNFLTRWWPNSKETTDIKEEKSLLM